MSQKLIEVHKNIQQGQAPDHPLSRDVVWAEGENVVFASKGVRPSAPQFRFAPKLSNRAITGMSELRLAGVPNLFWGTQTSLFRYNPVVGTEDVTNSLGAYALNRNQLWTFQPWGNYIFATAGDAPQIWPEDPGVDDTFDTIDLTGAGFTTAKIAAVLQGFPILANTDISETDVRWGVGGDITNWTPTVTNSAGGIDVYGLRGPIIATYDIGIGLGLFSKNMVHVLTYIGPPQYFRADHLMTGIGVVSPHALTNVGFMLYGMSATGLWKSDGSAFTYFDRPDFHRTIYDNLNTDLIDLCHLWHNQEEEMVVVFYASRDASDIDSAVGYHYPTDRLVKLLYARTATTEHQVFDQSILGDSDGNLFAQTIVPAGDEYPNLPATNQFPVQLEAWFQMGVATGNWMGKTGTMGYNSGGWGPVWFMDG